MQHITFICVGQNEELIGTLNIDTTRNLLVPKGLIHIQLNKYF